MTGPDRPEPARPGPAGADSERLRARPHGERELYGSRWLRLSLVDVELPDGGRTERHVVRLPTVAVAAVLDDRDQVLMMWRHRFVNDQWGWELPGGLVEAGEDARATAAREVLEETGWRPGPLRSVLDFQPVPGVLDMPYRLYAADGAEHVGEPTDTEEAALVRWLPMAGVLDLARGGELLGAGTLVALLLLLAERGAPE